MASVVRKGPKLLKSVALIGFMGAGKSSVGRLLAERMHARFVDLDQRVEEEQQQTIADLFRQGEGVFRAAEVAALRRLLRERPGVWALGGGTPCTAEARAALVQSRCLVVWLQVDWAEVQRRTAGSERPLLAADGAKAARLLEARRPAYQAAAQWWVDAAPPAADVAAVLARRLKDEGYVEGPVAGDVE